jgi:hypothetical protein
MQTTVYQQILSMRDGLDKEALRPVLSAIADRLSSQATVSAGLVIKTGGSTLAKTGSTAFQGVAGGVPVTIAGSTDMPALTGINFSAGQYQIVCFFIDSGSNVSVAAGVPGATLAKATFPDFGNYRNKALVGYLIITYASAFTGGTTPLDTATTVYVSPTGAFDPTLLVTL